MSAPTLPPFTPSGDIDADKATWRSLVRAARRDLVAGWDAEQRTRAARQLGSAALAFVREYADAHRGGALPGLTVTAFEPMPTEPPVDGVTAALQARGVRVLVPVTLEKPRLDWADLADPERTPLGQEVLAEVDVAFIPGLVISADGVRLGQGGAYYDTTLPRLRELSGGAPVLVVLHDHEVVPQVPAADHDAAVDGVLRPSTGVTLLGKA